MVENDVLIFESKLKNAIKHSIGRHVVKIEDCKFTDIGMSFVIKTPFNKEGETIIIPEKYDIKDAVCYALHLPQLQSFMYIEVVGTEAVQKSVLKSFSNQTIPSTFKICKIPKKQIQVQVHNKKDYVNISLQSYQKLISFVDKVKKWPASIKCQDFMEFFKRREFVTILLQISQLAQQ